MSASRVSLDHFDPEGVRELSRSLSRSSTQARVTSVRSDKTLATDEPFSLEKTLRAALDKYVHFIFYSSSSPRELIVSRHGNRQHDSGVKRRELGVYFKNLQVTGVGAVASQQETVGSMFNPKAVWEGFRNSRRPSTRTILHDFNGVIKPGEMLRKSVS